MENNKTIEQLKARSSSLKTYVQQIQQLNEINHNLELKTGILNLDRGSGITHKLIEQNEETTTVLAIAPKDSYHKPHIHSEIETVIVLSGVLHYYIKNEERILKAGESITCPARIAHSFKCYKNCTMIMVWTPPFQIKEEE